ncbi:MAG: response regulator [Coriobacteriia bacterium]|nr:response regulator [Coriobacteriia bacterium]
MPGGTDKYVVLTVDDDPIILNEILETLKYDYLVRPFTSGETALAFLEEHNADLILLDHHMPGMTGLDLLQILQNNPKTHSIPVIFLTGSADNEDEVHALEIGAIDYLLKPFNPSSLLTRVRLQLELKEHRHHLEELVEARTEELQVLYEKLKQRDRITLDLLAIASDMRDHETGTHIECVVLFTKVIVADLLEFPHDEHVVTEQYGNDIIDSVKLHDLGKIGIPDGVLLKQGKLTAQEMRIMQAHPVLGAEMLMQAITKMGDDSMLWTAYEIIYGHHEKWDGTGYPMGVKGTLIPLSARITAVVDVFDALTSARPYKNAWPAEEAFAYINDNAGKHFDPYLAKMVRRREREFREILSKKEAIASRTIFDFSR